MPIESFRAALQNPQREYLFSINLPTAVSGTTVADVEPLCRSVKFGQYNMNDVVAVRYGPEHRKYAGTFALEQPTFRFLRTNPDVVVAYFEAWRQLILKNKIYFQPKSLYAFPVQVMLLDVDSDTPSEGNTATLVNAFPTTFPAVALNMDGENVVYHDVTFSCDQVNWS